MRVPIVSDLADAIMGKPKVQPEDMYLPANLPEIDFSQYNTPEFHEEQNRRAELNIKVDSKDAMIKYVKESSLSLRCKNAWMGIIETYYDRNILLSDLTGKKVNQGRISTDEKVQIAYWRAKIDVMGSVRCNSWKSDRLNPVFTTIEQLVLTQIWFRLSRTKGPDRESILSRRVDIQYNAMQAISQRMRGGNE